MKNKWFISDTHFGHFNSIKHSNRPFKTSEDMDEGIITNWNSVVKNGDDVYHLGDYSMKCPFHRQEKIFNRLNGQKHLIMGNHDELKHQKKLGWNWIKDLYHLRIGDIQIHLHHYPERSWRNSYHRSWDLFGHVHSQGNFWTHGLSCDVGVDTWDYTPVHLDQITEIMESLESKTKDEPFMWRGCKAKEKFDIFYMSQIEDHFSTI